MEIKTGPVTLGEHILLDRFLKDQNWESLAQLIVKRTSLSTEEVLAIDDYELPKITQAIMEAANHEMSLTTLGRGLDS